MFLSLKTFLKNFLIIFLLLFFSCPFNLSAQEPPAAASPQEQDLSVFKADSSSPFILPQFSKQISMDFQEAPLVDVLKMFSKQSGMNIITTQSLSSKRVTIYLDNVPVGEALEQILRANNLMYELQADSDIYLVKPLPTPEIELITRVYPLKHATVSSAKIRKTLTIGATTTSNENSLLSVLRGIITKNGQITEDPRTNSIIITDIVGNFPHIERVIARMDIPVPQVLIEVEMLEVSKTISDKIGVKIGETPLSFTGAERDHFYPWNQNKLLDKGRAEFDTEFRVGTIDASGFAATLQFLRTQSDTKYLARPRIMTLNNESAQIKISTQEAIGVRTETSSAQSLAYSSLEAERVETGVILTVTPQANIETGEITLALDPKVTIARTGQTFSNTTFRDPEERGSQSLLRVQSGDTVIMGGLLRNDQQTTITKVPILGDIPFIGQAFRHKLKTDDERELIIFITPHILNETPIPKTTIAEPREILREQNISIRELSEDQETLIKANN